MLIILMPPHQTHTHNLGTFFVMEHKTLMDYFMFRMQCFLGPHGDETWPKTHINTNIENVLLMICSFYSFHDFSGRQFFWSFANYPNTRLILGVVPKSYFHFRKSFANEYTLILKEAEFSEDVPSFPFIPFFTLDLPRSSS